MSRIKIEKSEFIKRIERIQEAMEKEGLDALMVYGDEYRKENLRYVCNFWPIFERGACFIPRRGKPIYAGAPEGERYAREMCVWDDIRNIREFACVSVPEAIDFPLAKFSSFKAILGEVLRGGKRLGLAGQWDMPAPFLARLKDAAPGLKIIDSAKILSDLRLIKSPAEIACMKEAGRITCLGYKKLIAAAIPGNTERMAAGAGEGACRAAGAEAINFMVFGSGKRANTIIGRTADKVIRDGEMVMASMAVQYEGYVTTAEFPFVAGKASARQRKLLETMFDAADLQLKYIRDGIVAGDMVKAVRDVFRQRKLSKYDIYPPMHGAGLAEAESPYPSEKATYTFRAGMCVNTDISLFGSPAGSNRIEEGFVITKGAPDSLTPYIRTLCEQRKVSTDEIV